MTLTERISEDMKTAMKARDTVRLETVRSIRAALLELDKSGREVDEDDRLKAVINQAKRRKDAIEQYSAAGREDLAERERAELAVIEEYLPRQLSEGEIEAEVDRIIAETGANSPSDFKVVMPKAMASMRGRADGARVQQIVRSRLGA